MSLFKHGRYSGYLRPISYLIDLVIINALALLYFFTDVAPLTYSLFISASWITLSIAAKFYDVYRYTREVTILALIIRQLVLFTLIVFAFYGYFNELDVEASSIIKYSLSCFLLITILKFAIYYLLQKYRVEFGGNYRTTVILGKNKNTIALEGFFKKNPEYGYTHKRTFDFNGHPDTSLQNCFEYINQENIDEIYCSISELTSSQITKVVDFADNNLKILKFLPDNKEIFAKKLKYEYYDYLPILTLRNIPLQDSINQVIKRSFDILFSSAVIIFILSWLTPLIAILIKLESRGPVFFKQSRNGFNYKEFDCYSFGQ